MDACGTYSAQMVKAFGVIPFSPLGSTRTVADYVQWHRGPRAFIGWDKTLVGPACDSADYERVWAQTIVLELWKAGVSVQDAMIAWDGYLEDKEWEPGQKYSDIDPSTPDPDAPGQTLDRWKPMGTWKISGCVDMNRYSPFGP